VAGADALHRCGMLEAKTAVPVLQHGGSEALLEPEPGVQPHTAALRMQGAPAACPPRQLGVG
jgi:hypothetical protein